MHSAFFSWDGKVVATMDEVGGGTRARVLRLPAWLAGRVLLLLQPW